MKIKQFIKKHKKQIAIIGGVSIGVAIFAMYKRFSTKDIEIPKWEGFDIDLHFADSTDNGVRYMRLNAPAWKLGELGDHLINDELTWANADIPVDIIIGYCSN